MVGKVSCSATRKSLGKWKSAKPHICTFCTPSHVCKWLLRQAKNFWWASGGGLIAHQFQAQKFKQMHSITFLNFIALSSLSDIYLKNIIDICFRHSDLQAGHWHPGGTAVRICMLNDPGCDATEWQKSKDVEGNYDNAMQCPQLERLERLKCSESCRTSRSFTQRILWFQLRAVRASKQNLQTLG